MGLELHPDQVESLHRYLDLLLIWRRRMPLVSQRSAAEIIAKHFEDSFAIVRLVHAGTRVADLGSGGGFPGLVLAMVRPQAQFVLVESKRRKASFLREVVRTCGAGHVQVAETRVEEFAAGKGAFDLVVSRAVWPSSAFFALARPLLRSGGIAVAMKTPGADPVENPPPGYVDLREQGYRLSGGEARLLLLAEAT
jgi:16S rRNA (guanine527-N7)-methyltransferase